MTDDKIKDDEPSIEEILSSIRDIISDEDDEEKPAEDETPVDDSNDVAESAADDVMDADDDDVLDLTDIAGDETVNDDEIDIDAMFNEEEGDDPLAGINLAHPEDDDLDFIDTEVQEPLAEEAVNDDGVDDILSSFDNEPETLAEDDNNADALLNNAASSATVSSLARLAENIAVSRTASGTTLEDIVRQLLRPMLKEWLDDNLPDVIERLVAKELERLAEKASRK